MQFSYRQKLFARMNCRCHLRGMGMGAGLSWKANHHGKRERFWAQGHQTPLYGGAPDRQGLSWMGPAFGRFRSIVRELPRICHLRLRADNRARGAVFGVRPSTTTLYEISLPPDCSPRKFVNLHMRNGHVSLELLIREAARTGSGGDTKLEEAHCCDARGRPTSRIQVTEHTYLLKSTMSGSQTRSEGTCRFVMLPEMKWNAREGLPQQFCFFILTHIAPIRDARPIRRDILPHPTVWENWCSTQTVQTTSKKSLKNRRKLRVEHIESWEKFIWAAFSFLQLSSLARSNCVHLSAAKAFRGFLRIQFWLRIAIRTFVWPARLTITQRCAQLCRACWRK